MNGSEIGTNFEISTGKNTQNCKRIIKTRLTNGQSCQKLKLRNNPHPKLKKKQNKYKHVHELKDS